MKRTPLTRRDRRAMLFGLALLGPPLLYFGAVKPYLGAIAEVRDHIATDGTTLSRERALLALAPRTTTFRGALDSVISASRARLFDARDDGIATADLRTYLAQLARQNQVWLRSAEPGDVSMSSSNVRTLPLEIQVESDFEGILSFLRAIEQGTKLLRVDQLSITGPGADTSKQHIVQMHATVTGYALGDASAPAPVKAPASESRP